LLFCAGASLAGGCDEPHLRTLTAADVTGLPPGDAVGTGFSGLYQSTNTRLLGCACRTADTCSALATSLNGGGASLSFTVTQSGGAIAFDLPCTGGVDADGRYKCGGMSQTAAGQSFSLLTGRFIISGVLVEGMTVHWDATTADALLAHDCDFSIQASLLYFGP
jgi:hypothetical protein